MLSVRTTENAAVDTATISAIGSASFEAAHFRACGSLSRQQRRVVKAWLRQLDTGPVCGAQVRTARACRVKRHTVWNAVRRYRRLLRRAMKKESA